MLPYTTILVLALAVSNVSPALSAPVLQVREQSLSHRGPKVRATLGKRVAWGKLLKKVGIDLGIGVASTVAGYALLDKITGPSESAAPSQEAVPAAPPPAAAYPPSAAAAPPPAAAYPPPAAAAPPPAAAYPPPAAAYPPPAAAAPPPATAAPPPATSGPATGPATSGPTTGPATNPNNAGPTYTGTHHVTTIDPSTSSVFGRSVSNKNR